MVGTNAIVLSRQRIRSENCCIFFTVVIISMSYTSNLYGFVKSPFSALRYIIHHCDVAISTSLFSGFVRLETVSALAGLLYRRVYRLFNKSKSLRQKQLNVKYCHQSFFCGAMDIK